MATSSNVKFRIIFTKSPQKIVSLIPLVFFTHAACQITVSVEGLTFRMLWHMKSLYFPPLRSPDMWVPPYSSFLPMYPSHLQDHGQRGNHMPPVSPSQHRQHQCPHCGAHHRHVAPHAAPTLPLHCHHCVSVPLPRHGETRAGGVLCRHGLHHRLAFTYE